MRLFLALDLPPGLRTDIERLVTGLRTSLQGWRWIRSGGVHLTLRFLGEVSEEALPALSPRWRAAAAGAGPVRLEVGPLGTFPSERAPRVLWLGARDTGEVDRLGPLAAALEEAARQEGFAPEVRGFCPHLTLARAAGRSKPTLPPLEPVVVSEPAEVRAVTLFRSVLGRGGAVHMPLEAYSLGGQR